MTIDTLDQLLVALRTGTIGSDEYNEWTDLPTFGGPEPESTIGVWSWDPERLLIGTCRDDIEIVDR